jgi:DNA-binding response OmpR family regulator
LILTKSNILVVEDDPPSRRAMRNILSSAGYPSCSAATLAFASDLLSWAKVLVLDLMLPDGNGVDLLRKIRNESLPIRVAVITASVDEDLLSEVASLNPDAIFPKPLEVARFIKWLDGIRAVAA